MRKLPRRIREYLTSIDFSFSFDTSRIKGKYIRGRIRLKYYTTRFFAFVKRTFGKTIPFFSYVKSFILEYGIYGFLLTLVSWGLFGNEIRIRNIIGFGIIVYFIKVELPYIIRAARR